MYRKVCKKKTAAMRAAVFQLFAKKPECAVKMTLPPDRRLMTIAGFRQITADLTRYVDPVVTYKTTV